MPLQLDSLLKATEALRRSIESTDSAMPGASVDLQNTLRAGVVQNFSVAYEQCWKFIQRWMRANRTYEDADFPRSRKELFRMAAYDRLISDPLPWFEFGEMRNLTVHTYDMEKAIEAYEAARRFLPHAEALLHVLEKANQ